MEEVTSKEQSVRLISCGILNESSEAYCDNLKNISTWRLAQILDILPAMVIHEGEACGLTIIKGEWGWHVSYAAIWDVDLKEPLESNSESLLEALVTMVENLTAIGYSIGK